MAERQVIRFNGNNEVMFVRQRVDKALEHDAQITVPQTHVAILEKDGVLMQTFEPGTYDIYERKSVFNKYGANSVDIIFMSNTAKLRMPWGTPQYIDARDPVTQLPIKVGASGILEVQIGNPRQFYLEFVGTQPNYSLEQLQRDILDRLLSMFKPYLAQTIREKSLTYDMFDEKSEEIADGIVPKLTKVFADSYGLKVFAFYIRKIVVPPEAIQAIELERRREIAERRAKEAKAEHKMELKEELAELERLSDKEWEREKYLLALKGRDYNRYMEVCEAIGWTEGKAKSAGGKSGGFCPKCGTEHEPDMLFCHRCGQKLGDVKPRCGRCGKENPAASAFCCYCGNALNK